ncbi:MAG TPA: hypothetical protein VNY35_05820 [Solirubrobacteraceae bacterium]|jgi:hypothetical protein|nr:hypothetical protein [Solirubrobacteraceae bacterium]
MIVKKLLLAAAAGALMTGPAWALPALAPANQGKGHRPSTTPNNTDNPGSSHRSSEGTENTGGNGGKSGDSAGSHKCKPHNVGYVASGTLLSQTLTKNTDGSYSGPVTVEVNHTNHHAKSDKGTKVYTLKNVHVTFGLADTNGDGSVGLDDLKAGDRVKLLGQITVLGKNCSQTGFTATTTIRHIVFHAPATP